MEPFDCYFKRKMEDPGFKTLYEAECNVCARTMAIFEKVDGDHISMIALARDVKTDLAALEALRDADHCDPGLVIRLCRHLGLPEPDVCPRRDGASKGG